MLIMGKPCQVRVNDSIELDINTNEIFELDTIKITNSQYHILKNNKPYKGEIINSNLNNKKYEVKVNNNIYNININNKLDLLIKEMGFSSVASKKIGSIKAPMPGLILEINVNVEQEVKENDPLLILEAMKMENIITSPRDGIIKSIAAKKGDAVEKNQLLSELE